MKELYVMVKKSGIFFNTVLLRFDKKGEKTGWTYLEVSAELASALYPGNKKIFQVKGAIDAHTISGASLLPMGEGKFILPVNVTMRKGIRKKEGAMVQVHLQRDLKKYTLNKELMACLAEEPDALAYFKTLAPSHQNYFSKWVDAAKTDTTKVTRLARILHALQVKWDYGQMIRFYKREEAK